MDTIMSEANKSASTSKLVKDNEHLEATRREFIEWVDHILDRKKWTGTDLANASGLAPSTVLRILNSKTHQFNISFMTIRKISEGSGFPIPRSLMEAHDVKMVGDVPEQTPKPRPAATRAAPVVRTAQDFSNTPTVPVRYVSSLPSALVARVHQELREPCPPQMAGDDTAFAFRMPDDSLAPLVRGGMMMFATKRRDPASGDILLVTDADGRSKVRLVDSVDEDGIHTKNDGKSDLIKFDDIKDFGVVEGIWRRS
jgi:transcriptional regulator with XRE-family HTH domain